MHKAHEDSAEHKGRGGGGGGGGGGTVYRPFVLSPRASVPKIFPSPPLSSACLTGEDMNMVSDTLPWTTFGTVLKGYSVVRSGFSVIPGKHLVGHLIVSLHLMLLLEYQACKAKYHLN